MKYRMKRTVVVDAMQLPVAENQELVRNVACWMVDHGYVEPGLEVNDVDEPYAYGDKVLPSYGENFLEIVYEDSDVEVTVHPGEWVVRGITGHWFKQTAEEFAETYEECE